MDVGLFSRSHAPPDDDDFYLRPSTRAAIAVLDLRIAELQTAYARVAPILDELPSGETEHHD